MRTSDENQRGSTHPLFKWPRRPGGARAKQHNAAWLAAGGALVVVLVGVVAWLAHVNATTLRPLPVADARGRALPVEAPAPRLPAAIIDEPAERAVLLAQAPVPPLVMLKPAAPAARPAPAPARTPQAAATARPKAPDRAVVARTAAAPKKPRPAAPVMEAEPVDRDIALISAILAQSSRHAAERAPDGDAACPAGKKCPAKTPDPH